MKTAGVVRRLFLLSVSLALVSFVVVAGLSWKMRQASARAQTMAEQDNQRTGALLALIGKVMRVQSTIEQIVRERDPDRLEAMLAERDKAVRECTAIVRDADSEAGELSAAVNKLFAAGEKSKEAVLLGDYAVAQMTWLEQASPAFESVLGAITDSEARQQQAHAAAEAASRASDRRVQNIAIGASFLSIAVLLGITMAVLRRVQSDLTLSVRDLSQAAAQMAGASNLVSTSSQTLARGASQQAASLEESSASSAELQSMTQRNAVNAQSVTGLMAETAGVVGEANRKLEGLVASMKSIEESSGKVSRIIQVIDEIAFQTNILALNAAVEAARAGVLGQGFAVVADEVRNLAQRCAQAANDTTNLIQESAIRSRDGSLRLAEVAQVIDRVTSQADRARVLADEVNAGSEQQAKGISQLAQTLNQMQRVTQQTAASAEESASAAEQTSAQSEAMRGIVHRLEILVGVR